MSRGTLASRFATAILAVLLVTFCVSFLSLCVGDSFVPPTHVLRILADPTLQDVVESPDASLAHLGREARIVREIRLPRVVLAALVGASLSLAGAAFQGLLRNPLADPYIVGTSSGAACGAAIAIVLGLSSSFDVAWPARPLFAFVGALATMYFVFALSRVDGRLPVDTFLLAGVVVGSFLWAFVSFLMAASHGKMQEIVFWLMGDLSMASWPMIRMMAPYFVIGAVALLLLSHRLNLLSIGEESAAALGVEVERTKLIIVVFASLLTAAAVSVSGLIGFVGLMVPHLTRSIWGPDHRVLLPACALGGAAFLVLADTAARLMSPAEIPVGVLTALFGGPFFFVILRRRLLS